MDFFPEDSVWVADLHAVKSSRYIRAGGVTLPFCDDAFDIAVSCDTLEHIPARDRNGFIRELFRVAGRFVILIAPFRSALNDVAEDMIQETCMRECGEANKALVEHAQYGLPNQKKTEALIRTLSTRFLSFPSGNIYNWLLMNSVNFTVAPMSMELYREVNRIYNLTFYDRDHSRPAYRTGFVACKRKTDIRFLNAVAQQLPRWFAGRDQDANASPETIRAFGTFLATLGDRKAWLAQALEAAMQYEAVETTRRLRAIENSRGWQWLQRYRAVHAFLGRVFRPLVC